MTHLTLSRLQANVVLKKNIEITHRARKAPMSVLTRIKLFDCANFFETKEFSKRDISLFRRKPLCYFA